MPLSMIFIKHRERHSVHVFLLFPLLETDEVVLIKLAERLHNMRTIEFINESKVQQKTKETLELFIPLARRLDNKKLIDELNDLSIKHCD